MQNWWFTDNWTPNQFQAFMMYCWTNSYGCTPANGKGFMKTDMFKKA